VHKIVLLTLPHDCFLVGWFNRRFFFGVDPDLSFSQKEREGFELTNSLGDKVLSLAPLTRLGDPRKHRDLEVGTLISVMH